MIPLLFALAAQAPDSARQAHFTRVLHQANDSLDRVRGAAAGFRTDLSISSSALVLQRAARVHGSCRGADAALVEVESLLAGGVYRRTAQREQAQLQASSAELRHALARCQREWAVPSGPTVAQADSLRAWGPYRTAQLDAALRRYTGSVQEFMQRAGLKTTGR